MRRPRWLERWLDRQRAKPRSAIDHWIGRHREQVKRLPRWLTGSLLSGSIALGIYWAVTGRGLMRVWLWLMPGRPDIAAMGTIAYTVAPMLFALWLIARIVRRRSPSNLPTARLRE